MRRSHTEYSGRRREHDSSISRFPTFVAATKPPEKAPPENGMKLLVHAIAARRSSRSTKVAAAAEGTTTPLQFRPSADLTHLRAATPLSPFVNPVAMEPDWTRFRAAMTARTEPPLRAIRNARCATTRVGERSYTSPRAVHARHLRGFCKRKYFREARTDRASLLLLTPFGVRIILRRIRSYRRSPLGGRRMTVMTLYPTPVGNQK